MRTKIALLLIFVILASGLIAIEPAFTQISPNVPTFTLKIEDDSRDIVNATGTYYVQIRFIDVVIKNDAPLSHYAVVNESIVKLYYNIRVKDHNQDWTTAIVTPNLAPSTANYTTVKFGLGSTNPDPGGWSIWIGNITSSGQVDFQVLGVDGFYTKLVDNPPCWRIPQYSVFNETGRSAWSNTQTITIPNGSTS
ncbi:MAG: hypothetical protein M1490_00005 [Candidatus Bathyarchaeota archaeon]|nr:hypothetical protein [Candidatus Bathyarchaeota archaeon]